MVQCSLWQILEAATDQAEVEVLKEGALMIEAQEGLWRCTRQFVTIVERVAKFLSVQLAVSLFSAAVVLKEIGVLIQEDLKIEMKRKEYLKLSVMSVEAVVQFLSGQVVISRSTAVTVLEIKREPEAKKMGSLSS